MGRRADMMCCTHDVLRLIALPWEAWARCDWPQYSFLRRLPHVCQIWRSSLEGGHGVVAMGP